MSEGARRVVVGGTQWFWGLKRVKDVVLCVMLFPVLLIVGGVLVVLNPRLNAGPLWYRQTRVGQHNKLFVMHKFRTMSPADSAAKFADEERHRITPFARLLRRYRIDELPQIINVLRGEMSLIGPRPEQPEFVAEYAQTIPQYAARHVVRPGLSGLSQVVQGYTSDADGTHQKLALDLRYITQSGWRMEGYILWRTLVTVATGYGAL